VLHSTKKRKALHCICWCIDRIDKMEEAGRIVEEILKYVKEARSVSREDIKDTFGLEEEKIEGLSKFLLGLKLIEMDNQIRITKSGLEFLQL